MTKRRILIFALIFIALVVFGVAFTQPLVIHRLATKTFTGYELYLLKYPNSHLVGREIRPTSKVTMATDYTFYSPDDVQAVLRFMEQKRAGYVQLEGSYVIVEPTFRNHLCANETAFKGIFQILEQGAPYIEVSIYPAAKGGTSIRISENWTSMGFPAWLRTWQIRVQYHCRLTKYSQNGTQKLSKMRLFLPSRDPKGHNAHRWALKLMSDVLIQFDQERKTTHEIHSTLNVDTLSFISHDCLPAHTKRISAKEE